jgi:hypothetical protein
MSCDALYAEASATIAANQTCKVDADCHFVDAECIDNCSSFVNRDGAAALAALVQQLVAQGCAAGCVCSALPPACVSGRCTVKAH